MKMKTKRWTEKEMQLIKNAAKAKQIVRRGLLGTAFDLHNGGGLEHKETALIVKKLRRARNKIVKLNSL